EQERRHREDEQHVLDHVGAEQIVVRQIVDRARERPEQDEQPAEERGGLGRFEPRVGVDSAPPEAGRQVRAGEEGEPDDNRGVRVPSGPVEALGPQGRRPRGPGYDVRHDQRMWRGSRMKALNSAMRATMIAIAMMSGPTNKARM